MVGQRKPLRIFFAVAALYGALWAGREGYRRWTLPVRLDTVKRAHLHYDLVELRLRVRDRALRERWKTGGAPRAAVARDGRRLTTVAGITWVDLRWDEARGAFIGLWPCPWNARDGRYQLELEDRDDLGERLRAADFEIARRVPHPVPRRFVVLSLESAAPLAPMRVRAPDGTMKGWRGLLDWVQYMEADAFWMLIGQTPGAKPDEIWLSENLALIPLVAEECRKRGIGLGLYAMNYLTTSSTVKLPRYEYAVDVEDGRTRVTRAISLRDPNRPKDVAELLKRFRDVPGVEFLGLDYIRNALGGVELADDFFAEMPGVRPPEGWAALSVEERRLWFFRKKAMRKDLDFIDAWQWWRARKVALIVKQIREELGPDKPLWAFTLTWDKGWHHGQDPVMMNDAGVDADALMLYEATSEQFDAILKDWREYVRGGDVQLVVGDIVDWPLHQRSPRGPKALYDRSVRAIDRIYGDGRPAYGLFVHDLGRALWSTRLGPHSGKAWLDEGRRAARYFRARAESEK